MFKIYNTVTQKKEFVKLDIFGLLKIYVCGITVYDYCHFGHARLFIFFDSIIRYLRFLNCNIIYIRNITDIDDKIILKSKYLLISFNKLVYFFLNVMKNDFKNLNLLCPTYEPRATYFINYIVGLVSSFNKINYSYKNNSGDVYYFVNKYLKYGNISNRSVFDNFLFSRQNKNEKFKNFLYDFVLWKTSNIYKPFWNCFYGRGRPGWHIECSTMSMYYLGDGFDIHGGGLDLVFPHHENECAQSEGLTKKLYSKIWMHIGFVEINKLKMSKSFKNFVTINHVLKKYNCEIIRYFILSSHYRSPLDFCFDKIELAKKILIKFYLIFLNKFDIVSISKNSIFEKKFFFNMNNDFNTIECFAMFFDILYEANSIKNYSLYRFLSFIKLLNFLGKIIGFFFFESKNFLKDFSYNYNKLILSNEEINDLVFDRFIAKSNYDWKKSDFIRDYLLNFGIILEDKKNITIWRRV